MLESAERDRLTAAYCPAASGVARDISQSLRAGIHVEVVGLAGSGRSWVLREVTALLESAEVRVIVVTATPCPRGSDQAGLIMVTSPREGLRASSSQFRRGLDAVEFCNSLCDDVSPQGTVLVVDDADWLDPEVQQALLAAANLPAVTLLSSLQPAGVNRGNTLVRHVGLSQRFGLPAWRPYEIDQLLRDQLGIRLESAALGLVTNAGAGLPGLVTALVHSLACHEDRLVRSGAQYLIAGPVWSAQATPAIESLLADLDQEALAALGLLAMMKSVRPGEVTSLCTAEQIRAIENAGLLLTLNLGDADEMVVVPPVLADYFAEKTSQWEKDAIASAVGADRVGPAIVPEPDDSIHTALLSYRSMHFWQEELPGRRQDWEDSRTARPALRYLVALSHIGGAVEQIRGVIAKTRETGPELDRLLLATWWACHQGIVQGRIAQANGYLEQMRQQLPEFVGAIAATKAHIALVTTQACSPAALTIPGRSEHQLSIDYYRAVKAELCVARGMPLSALECLDDADEAGSFLHGETGDVARAMAMFLTGDIDGATKWATQAYRSSQVELDVSWPEGHAYLIALSLAMTGRFTEFDEHMRTVSSLVLPGSINVNFLVATFAFASVLATERGLTDLAVAYAERAGEIQLGSDIYPGFSPQLAMLIATGSREEISKATWQATLRRSRKGYITSAVMSGMVALEYDPDPEHASQIAALADGSEADLLKTVSAYASTLVEPCPESILAVARELTGHGLLLYSVRAGVRAAAMHYQRGEKQAAAAVADETWSWIGRRELGLADLFGPLVMMIGMTDRERDILARVSAGHTPAEMAADLVLSVRTIEQHLHRISRKLGVSGRKTIAGISRTWMSAFIPQSHELVSYSPACAYLLPKE